MIDIQKQFKEDLKSFNINLTEKQCNLFEKYYEMLINQNKVMNLTAITEKDEVYKKHFTDSLSIRKVIANLDNEKYKMLDIGTGAGFPGIPIKIVYNNLDITLLDSLNKRINFLNDVIKSCELNDINTIHGRAEDFARNNEYRENFDFVVSRAVANLSTLSEYCLPYVKIGGCFISYKADIKNEELDLSKNAIRILGGEISKIEEFKLPNTDFTRKLIVIKKIKKTSSLYPRKAGLPSKNPIE